MNVRHPMSVLQSFSIKNIFYDKMALFSRAEIRKGLLKVLLSLSFFFKQIS